MLSARPRRCFGIVAGLAALQAAYACGTEDTSSLSRRGQPGGSSADAAPGGGALDGSRGPLPASCMNGSKDGDESDVDCGGAVCAPCAHRGACITGADCVAQVCTGGRCNADVGCSDGTREGFLAVDQFPAIAACAGGWSIGGLLREETMMPACGGKSGNDSPNPSGAGCNVADLCQAGWHVCKNAADVAFNSKGVGCAAAGVTGTAFFAMRQSGAGAAMCGEGNNDLFGCGDTGAAADPSCAPVDRFSHDLCATLPSTWSCGSDGTSEALNVTKTGAGGGGVLCCRH